LFLGILKYGCNFCWFQENGGAEAKGTETQS
jgi:hypothetical protein